MVRITGSSYITEILLKQQGNKEAVDGIQVKPENPESEKWTYPTLNMEGFIINGRDIRVKILNSSDDDVGLA